jgi:hypothetical protein
MPTAKARVQVTIDDELEQAMLSIDASPASRSKLVRDMALRGARAVQEERARASETLTVLLEIADGTRDHDFAAPAALHADRSDRLP